MLAAAYRRLGNAEEAATAASEALDLHPVNPEAYRQISSIFAAQGRIDDAAVALIEGGLITSDLSLRSDLLRLVPQRSWQQLCDYSPGRTVRR